MALIQPPRPFRLILLGLLLLAGMPVRAADGPLILAIHPYRPATQLIQSFQPLADILGSALGRKVQLDISADYESHATRVGLNQVDLAFIGPAAFVGMWEKYGLKPLLGRLEINGRPTFEGVIITRADSPLRQLSEVRGKRMAFGDPQSTMSHLVPLYMLLQVGIDEDALGGFAFLGSHDDVALGVLLGDFDAGAVKEEVFDKYEGRGLRALQRTPAISEHLFVAASRLPPAQVETLRATLLSLKDHPAGLEALRAIKSTASGIVPASLDDYQNLRDILTLLHSQGSAP
ncbi:hypothetical protein JCM17960_17950 [Magnetospira thiophila]